MKKNSQDISEQAFHQPTNSKNHCHCPLPIYPKKLNEFDKLVYVASSIFSQKQKNSFHHAIDTSPFRPITPQKK